MNIAEMLKAEKKISTDYSRTNFGLQVGPSYPDLVRELAADAVVASSLQVEWMIDMIAGSSGMTPERQDAAHWMLNHPEAIKGKLSMLYWGIEIGRKLEREQSAVLKVMARADE